jgi:hypothetical protein
MSRKGGTPRLTTCTRPRMNCRPPDVTRGDYGVPRMVGGTIASGGPILATGVAAVEPRQGVASSWEA